MVVCSGDRFWAKVWDLVISVGVIIGLLFLLLWIASSNDRKMNSDEWVSTISLEKEITQHDFLEDNYDD